MNWLDRSGGILLAPRTTFRVVLFEKKGGIGDILLLMFVLWMGTAPLEIATAVFGIERGVGTVITQLIYQYVFFSLTPLLTCVAIALVLLGLERIRGVHLSIESVVSASVYVWVPVGVLGVVGSMLRVAGWDLWFLPHIPFSSFLDTQPSWGKIALRMAISYSWSVLLVGILVLVVREEERSTNGIIPSQARFLLGGLILISYLVGIFMSCIYYDQLRPIQVGDKAKNFILPRAEGGGSLALSSLKGKMVVIEFWATWCPKCVEHMPELERWAEAHPDVCVLAIHQGGSVSQVGEFIKKQSGKVIYLVDSFERVTNDYQVDTLPTFYVLDSAGKIVNYRIGGSTSNWLSGLTLHKS